MDEKRQQYYDALYALFETTGWDLFVEDVDQQIEHAKEAMVAAVDLRMLGFLQGRINAFAEIKALQANIEAQVATLAEDEDADL